MVEIWKDEMWADTIGPDDDFFSLGGDSLAAVRIMIRLKQAFGIEIPISQLLETPILRNFAKYVDLLRTNSSSQHQDAEALPIPDMEEGTV